MTMIIVYHDTETLARRERHPSEGETIRYCAIADWDEKENAKYDRVINLSSKKPEKVKNVL